MIDQAGTFAAVAITLYAAHHVGDYWVQTDHQARHKGDAGADGVLNCMLHVVSYLMTQTALLFIAAVTLDLRLHIAGILAGLAVSGATHYLADRREHGLMFKLARRLPGKSAFMKLGAPRTLRIYAIVPGAGRPESDPLDNPQLATGAWALDQAWHIFWGVFAAALLMVAL